jgi:hypothetical protein
MKSSLASVILVCSSKVTTVRTISFAVASRCYAAVEDSDELRLYSLGDKSRGLRCQMPGLSGSTSNGIGTEPETSSLRW